MKLELSWCATTVTKPNVKRSLTVLHCARHLLASADFLQITTHVALLCDPLSDLFASMVTYTKDIHLPPIRLRRL